MGSVRSVVDNSVAVLNPVSYNAYGTPDAAVGSPFAFTGEMRDSNGLQHHRARYYAPSLGVWISEDPLETPNRYGYVGGNVVNAVDPTGMDVALDKIEAGQTVYSCRCGWLDLTHANPIHALNLIRTVKNALNPQIYANTPNCTGTVFRTRLGTWTGYQMARGGAELFGAAQGTDLPWYFIPKNTPSGSWLNLSAQIYSDLIQEFEAQEAASWNPVARATGQSIEDLPSYSIGFFMAYYLEQTGQADAFYATSDQVSYVRNTLLNTTFMQGCEPIVDIPTNRRIFEEIEPASARSGKNTTFIPVSRASELDTMCNSTTRDASRIPFWLLINALLLGTRGTSLRKSDKKAGCADQAVMLPYPNNPDAPADSDLPESLLLYKCGSC